MLVFFSIVVLSMKSLYLFIYFCPFDDVLNQQKEAELRDLNAQLREAEGQREKINKDMGTIRQDIDTQKVWRPNE